MIIKRNGHGQSFCRRCDQKGIWFHGWDCMMYSVEGVEGAYCYECAVELEDELKRGGLNNEEICNHSDKG